MSTNHVQIKDGITQFKGRMPRNLFFEPVVSSTYLLEDEGEVVIFDPSIGKDISQSVEAYVRSRHENNVKWKKAFVVAGHSHYDHANNFQLAKVLQGEETHIYVHERGFRNGRVANQRSDVFDLINQTRKYYNPSKTFPFPNNLFVALALKRGRRTAAASHDGSDSSFVPEGLKERDLQTILIGDSEISGWRIGKKIIFATPGHSPCSITLLWPEKKALFVSDATWIGNPVFINGSLQDLRTSLEKMKALTKAGVVDLLLPGHGQITEGREAILSHLDFRLLLLETIKDEVLSVYHSCGDEKDIMKLTKVLSEESMFFRLLQTADFPKMVIYVHTIVALCLKEEGILK